MEIGDEENDDNVFDSVCISFTFRIDYYYLIISNNLKGARNGNTI